MGKHRSPKVYDLAEGFSKCKIMHRLNKKYFLAFSIASQVYAIGYELRL